MRASRSWRAAWNRERTPLPPTATIAHLEARLEDISAQARKLRRAGRNRRPDIIRNLEAQVAELSRHLSQPSAAMREFEDIGPRLDDIEKSLAGTRETILEAARQAAENAVRSFSGSKSDAAAVNGARRRPEVAGGV